MMSFVRVSILSSLSLHWGDQGGYSGTTTNVMIIYIIPDLSHMNVKFHSCNLMIFVALEINFNAYSSWWIPLKQKMFQNSVIVMVNLNESVVSMEGEIRNASTYIRLLLSGELDTLLHSPDTRQGQSHLQLCNCRMQFNFQEGYFNDCQWWIAFTTTSS